MELKHFKRHWLDVVIGTIDTIEFWVILILIGIVISQIIR